MISIYLTLKYKFAYCFHSNGVIYPNRKYCNYIFIVFTFLSFVNYLTLNRLSYLFLNSNSPSFSSKLFWLVRQQNKCRRKGLEPPFVGDWFYGMSTVDDLERCTTASWSANVNNNWCGGRSNVNAVKEC